MLNKDGGSEPIIHLPDPTVETCGHALALVEEGTFEPTNLQKPRVNPSTNLNTASSTPSNVTLAEPSHRNSLVSSQSSVAPQEADARVPIIAIEPSPNQSALKVTYQHFISAVVAAVSSSFCDQSMAIPLNYRTVLLPPSTPSDNDWDPQDNPVLGTFRTYLTTTGSLVISLCFSYCRSLSRLEDVVAANLMSPNRPVLAAPFGIWAMKQQAPTNGDNNLALDAGVAQTPNTQALSLRTPLDSHDVLWKRKCLKVMELWGLDASRLRSCAWLNLMVSRRSAPDENEARRSSVAVPWPGPLCFRKKPVGVSTTCRVSDNVLSGHEEWHDPLGNARGWFNASSEREERLAKRKAERAAAISKEANGNDPTAPRSNGQSPLALQRRPSAAAAGVMYPTPPDAIQQQPGVTPSFDGTSPGNAHPTAPVVDIEGVMPATQSMGETDNDAWDGGGQTKRDRNEGSMLGDSEENVFGEMGGDMFGDHDVTEDDFNFFDEQRPDNVDSDFAMPDAHSDAPPRTTSQIPQIVAEPPTPKHVPEETPPKPKPDDAVFAKPQLKHARSSLNDGLANRNRTERKVSAKRESSPFDPDTVFKRVRASLMAPVNGQNASQGQRKNSIFQKVDFDPKLPMINKKYEQGGLYDFTTNRGIEKPKRDPGSLPDNRYLERNGKLNKKLKEMPATPTLFKVFANIEVPTSQLSPARADNHGFGFDDSDVEPDDDDSSSQSEGAASPVKSSGKRALLDEEDAASQVTSFKEIDASEESLEDQLAIELSRLSKPEPPEVSLSRFFSDPEPLSLELGLLDEDLIQIAQLITEQAATGSVAIGIDRQHESKGSIATLRSQELVVARNSLATLESIIPSSLGGATPVRLKGYLDVADLPLQGQPNRMQPRAVPGRDPNAEQLRTNNLYQIPGPHLEVRRSDTKLSVLPSAVTFWESLGLAPSSGGKDISALCVFPGWTGMAEHIGTFLDRLKSVYESIKLGTFNNMELNGDLQNGVLPYQVDRISTSPDATVTGHGSALVESMEILRSSLLEWTAKERNLVIYFVYSPDNPGSIVEACSAFQRCFDMYSKTLLSRKESPQNELVLQLIPLDFISSSTSLVIPSPTELTKLCVETYDRCTLFLQPEFGGPTPCPAIMLEQPLPRIIDFKLTSLPSASLMHENSCIHVAYAQSIDERWVTAAWTDNRGQQQATASYCMARKGRPTSTTMNDIAHEIWLTTLDLISIWKVHWRIIITKCGPMEAAEMDFWVDLAKTEIKATVTMFLMTVDTSPSLQLIPPAIKLPQAATCAFYSTPVSTPQASILSPEQINTPATPMRDANNLAATPGAEAAPEADSDSFLIDATDQTWGAIAGHRLSNSNSLLELRPALVSGYLIKRTGTKIEDPPVVMEVNLVHTEATPRAYEPLLREMLSYFRGLGTLARARGMVDRETDVRPWHIAAAEKGVRALYLLL